MTYLRCFASAVRRLDAHAAVPRDMRAVAHQLRHQKSAALGELEELIGALDEAQRGLTQIHQIATGPDRDFTANEPSAPAQ